MPSLLLITGCASKPKAEIVLPPRPQRQELAEIRTIGDAALAISYYESLVEEWEAWGDTAEKLLRENP